MGRFIIESDFMYKDYRCITTFTKGGFRCGYVGVPKKSKLYGKNYSDCLDVKFEDIDNRKVDKVGIIPLLIAALNDSEYVPLDVYFNVHWSLTFAGDNHPVEDSELWWLGFDCGHAEDGIDTKKVEEIWGEEINPLYFDWEVRSLEYVQQECKNLVDQIIEYEIERR